MKRNESKLDLPFFARYLDGQEYPSVRTDVKAGPNPHATTKYPSDSDELAETVKYPSDGDDNPPTVDI
jgi:hypothetical protein